MIIAQPYNQSAKMLSTYNYYSLYKAANQLLFFYPFGQQSAKIVLLLCIWVVCFSWNLQLLYSLQYKINTTGFIPSEVTNGL